MPYFDNLWHKDLHDNKGAFTHRPLGLCKYVAMQVPHDAMRLHVANCCNAIAAAYDIVWY